MGDPTLQEQFDTIAYSIRNGQRKQAYKQMTEIISEDLCRMIDYFDDELCDPELALDAAKTFIRNIERYD